jgi:GNAT superfamily N-acetyltransferase
VSAYGVEVLDDPAAAWARVSEFMATDPVGHSVIASALLQQVAAGPSDGVWAVVTDASDAVVGVAMHTPPFGVWLSDLPAGTAATVARALHAYSRRPSTVGGPRRPVEEFAQEWAVLTGVGTTLLREEGVFRCDKVVPPPPVPGRLRRAGQEDAALVGAWGRAFAIDAGLPVERAETVAERMLQRPGLHLWEDDGPACMIAHTAPAAGVVRVGPVYTPPERRRRGYAAATTAAVTSLLRDAGFQVMLFTDLANPTSNGVYERIGYVRVGEAVELRFVPPDAGGSGLGDDAGHDG